MIPHKVVIGRAALLLLAVAPGALPAQTYPAKAIRVIAAQSAGGGTDLLARTLAQKLNEAWKQPVVVENRPGAAGNIGTELVVRAAPDGYTLLFSSAGPIVINPGLYPRLGFDPVKDLAPIAFVAAAPLMLVTHPSVPARTVTEFVALARSAPDKLNYGSGGSGSPPHLAAELFKTLTGTKMVHVPFKGSAPSVAAVVAGQVDLTLATVLITMPQVKGNRLRALGVTTPKRSQIVPDLPTVAESGVPGFEAQQWYALFGPASMPRDVVAKLSAETARIMGLQDVRDRLASDGAEPGNMTHEQFTAFSRAEAARWTKVIRDSGAKVE